MSRRTIQLRKKIRQRAIAETKHEVQELRKTGKGEQAIATIKRAEKQVDPSIFSESKMAPTKLHKYEGWDRRRKP